MTLSKTLIILVLLSSCVEVGFKNPQPLKARNLEEIPKEMLDFYTNQKKDSTENSITDLYSVDDFDATLSETTILKKWKGNYFLNQKENDLWHVFMIVPSSNNMYETYQLDGGNEKTVSLLKKITEVEEVFSDDGELKSLILDPSHREFKKIVKSGAFEMIEIF